MEITVVVPTIPPRRAMLARALRSIAAQELLPAAVLVELDEAREGAAVVRDRGLQKVATEWVAFLDDDDVFMTIHLAHVAACAETTGADYVYPWFGVAGGTDPFPHFFAQPWDNEHPHQTTITTLVRTEIAQKVGFQTPEEGKLVEGQRFGEDYIFTLGCMALGAKIIHYPERTWWWSHHRSNTSGLASRW